MSKLTAYLARAKEAHKKGQLSFMLRRSLRWRLSLRYALRREIRWNLCDLSLYDWLKKKYGYVLSDLKLPDEAREPSDRIWVCWLQGLDNAPTVCKVCIRRMQDFFGAERVTIITADNYSDYANIPDYIVDKWKAGIISHTHFSDILRACLLTEGGARGSTQRSIL